MSMKKLSHLIDKSNSHELVTILACSADCFDEDSFDHFQKSLSELGFVQTDVEYIYLKNQVARNDKTWQFIHDEKAKQESLLQPSIIIDFASSEAVDQSEFDGASEANCLSYYADENLLALAKQMGSAKLI